MFFLTCLRKFARRSFGTEGYYVTFYDVNVVDVRRWLRNGIIVVLNLDAWNNVKLQYSLNSSRIFYTMDVEVYISS